MTACIACRYIHGKQPLLFINALVGKLVELDRGPIDGVSDKARYRLVSIVVVIAAADDDDGCGGMWWSLSPPLSHTDRQKGFRLVFLSKRVGKHFLNFIEDFLVLLLCQATHNAAHQEY